MAIPSVNWDETKPAGTRDINLGDNDIREFKTQIRQIVEVDHEIASSGSGDDWGKHKILTLLIQAALTTVAGAGRMGVKVVSGIAELFYRNDAGTDTQITSNGTVLAPGAFTAGMIMMWSGTLATIPAGWNLCDGVAGRPNLLDKFVKGVATAATNPGTTGGAATHVHTGPSHNHTVTISTFASAGGAGGTIFANGGVITSSDSGTGNTGSGSTLPPYYEVAYIIKS